MRYKDNDDEDDDDDGDDDDDDENDDDEDGEDEADNDDEENDLMVRSARVSSEVGRGRWLCWRHGRWWLSGRGSSRHRH